MALKILEWVGSSKKDFMEFSDEVIDEVGYALFIAQMGQKHDDAKALKGFGSADILEIIADDKAGTYRTMYTVKFKDVVFVLHVFQKKSKQGIATPKRDLDMLKTRLKMAEEIYKTKYRNGKL